MYICSEPGCDVSSNDAPIFRTSPKGQPFEGKCREHVDPKTVDETVRQVVDTISPEREQD